MGNAKRMLVYCVIFKKKTEIPSKNFSDCKVPISNSISI